MRIRLDPRVLVLSALLAAPAPRVRADDAGTSRDPRPICRTRVCPEWGDGDRDRVRRRTPAPPPTTTTPPTSST